MKRDTDGDEAKTLSVPEAGWKYFRLGRNGSYDAARRGDIPVIKIGARLRVPVIALERKLAQVGLNTVANLPKVGEAPGL
jgi:Helix-turn-helix domain